MRLRLALAVLVLAAGCGSQPAKRAEAPLSDAERALMVQSFDEVWKTVRDRHYDPKFGGVDWDAVGAEFRPKVEAATTRREAVALMRESLERLGKSHFGIISADNYDVVTGEEDEPGSKPSDRKKGDRPDGEVGLDVRAIDGQVVVVAVDEGSPADKAGIRPGWTILEVNGRDLARSLARVNEVYGGQAKCEGMASYVARGAVMGREGETLKVKAADGGGRARNYRLEVVKMSGAPVVFGHLPPMHLEMKSERLASGVGYLAFSVFFDPPALMPWYRERIAEFAGAPGLIIDLRGNPGGIGGMAMGMGNMLVSSPNQKLGTMTTRDTTINFILNPQPGRYEGPVAVLVDELSMSTAEILSGGLQAIGRARIFGARTPGMALPSQVIKLPSGDGFQYAIANYVSADGRVLEGNGVSPDVVVIPARAALLNGEDPARDAAERWILSGANRAGS